MPTPPNGSGITGRAAHCYRARDASPPTYPTRVQEHHSPARSSACPGYAACSRRAVRYPTDSKSCHSILGLEESFIEKLIPECVGRSTNERYNLAKLITPKVLLPSPETARVIRA